MKGLQNLIGIDSSIIDISDCDLAGRVFVDSTNVCNKE